MPDRRARMLNVAEMPVVSVPVVSAGNWMREAAPALAPAAPRFQSEDEEPEEERIATGEPAFFAASAAAAPQNGHAGVTAKAAKEPKRKPDADPESARPRFSELAEEPVYTPLPRDYASDFAGDARGTAAAAAEEQRPAAATSALFSNAEVEGEHDLDVPAFMRRGQF
jgi:hypothetical protein